jgi:sulfonate transport system substrate-binding protein
MNMKKVLALCLSALMLVSVLSGCKKSTPTSSSSTKTYTLNVSGLNGSLNYLPVYIAEQKGWFKAAGLNIKDVMFGSGPVQMEALSSNAWDISCTGVGGVLSGVIGYNAVIVSASNSDDGTQTIFARNDSAIVKAGTGHNSVNSKIYGDAASWKGASVLCSPGTVSQYLLVKTLKGFGLGLSDVKQISMDAPTANSAFLAGQGDACVLTAAVSFSADKKNYTLVSSGNEANTGLMCNMVANKTSLADMNKKAAMEIFMQVYFKTLTWMSSSSNYDASYQYCSDFNQSCGITLNKDTAKTYLTQDHYYTLDQVYNMMHTDVINQKYSLMEGNLLDVLQFFIDSGKYKSTDVQKFGGHMDTSLIDALHTK